MKNNNELDKYGNTSKKILIANNAVVKYDTLSHGKNITISNGVELIGKKISIGDNVIIKPHTKIHANVIEIDRDTQIDANSDIYVLEKFSIGKRSILCNCEIKGRNIFFGDDFYSSVPKGKILDIGGGNCFYPHSNFLVGDRCTIHDVSINIAMPVKIGNDVGISHGTTFYTHYFWNSIFEGNPQKFDGITISDGCIIGADAFFLPGVTIGKNCVIGARSVITKNFMSDCIIGGNPAKCIKQKYKKKITEKERLELLRNSIKFYVSILQTKGFTIKEFTNSKLKFQITKDGKSVIILYHDDLKNKNTSEEVIILTFNEIQQLENSTVINLTKKTLKGKENELTDDLRDFLRKVGVRIFTERKFKSFKPKTDF